MLCDSVDRNCPEQVSPQGQRAEQWVPRARGRGDGRDCPRGRVSTGGGDNAFELEATPTRWGCWMPLTCAPHRGSVKFTSINDSTPMLYTLLRKMCLI